MSQRQQQQESNLLSSEIAETVTRRQGKHHEDTILKIVSSAEFVVWFYAAIHLTADGLLRQQDFFKERGSIQFLNPSTGQTYTTENSGRSNAKKVEYIPDDMTIYGGSVVTLLDTHMRILDRQGLLRNFVKSPYDITKRHTEDIDIIWWPRVYEDPSISLFDVKSAGLKKMIDTLEAELEKVFNSSRKIEEFKQIFLQVPAAAVKVKVKTKFLPYFRLYQIYISYEIDGEEYKISELTIHDGRQSQDMTRETHMMRNIYYSYSNKKHNTIHTNNPIRFPLTIAGVPYDKIDIFIPKIRQFVNHQIYAMTFFLNRSNMTDKLVKIWKRLYYVYLLYENIKEPNTLALLYTLHQFVYMNRRAFLEKQNHILDIEIAEMKKDLDKEVEANDERLKNIKGEIDSMKASYKELDKEKKNVKNATKLNEIDKSQEAYIAAVDFYIEQYMNIKNTSKKLIEEFNTITSKGGFVEDAFKLLYKFTNIPPPPQQI